MLHSIYPLDPSDYEPKTPLSELALVIGQWFYVSLCLVLQKGLAFLIRTTSWDLALKLVVQVLSDLGDAFLEVVDDVRSGGGASTTNHSRLHHCMEHFRSSVTSVSSFRILLSFSATSCHKASGSAVAATSPAHRSSDWNPASSSASL